MNYFTIEANPPLTKGKRKRKYSQVTAELHFEEVQDVELISRSLREIIEVAVDECCVWPH